VAKSGEPWGPVGLHGEFEYKVDEKGRVVVPPQLREVLEAEDRPSVFMITPSLEGHCLVLYDLIEFRKLHNRVMGRQDQVPPEERLTPSEQRAMGRVILARAARVECDSQGRILLPETLKQEVAIQRDVVFVGMMDRAELWEPTRWRNYVGDHRGGLTGVGAKLPVS